MKSSTKHFVCGIPTFILAIVLLCMLLTSEDHGSGLKFLYFVALVIDIVGTFLWWLSAFERSELKNKIDHFMKSKREWLDRDD